MAKQISIVDAEIVQVEILRNPDGTLQIEAVYRLVGSDGSRLGGGRVVSGGPSGPSGFSAQAVGGGAADQLVRGLNLEARRVEGL